MNTTINGVLIQGAQGISGAQGVQGVVGLNGRNGIRGISNILPVNTGTNISSSYLISPATTINLIGSTITAVPFLPAYNCSYQSLSIFVTIGVASSLSKILIYDDLNGSPNNLIFESTNIDCSTTGKKTIVSSGTFSAQTTYWLCVWNNGTNPTLKAIAVQSLSSIRLTTVTPVTCFRRSVAFGNNAPSTFGAITPVTTAPPLIVITLN